MIENESHGPLISAGPKNMDSRRCKRNDEEILLPLRRPSFVDVSIYLTILKVNGYRYEIPSLDLMAAFMTRPIFKMNRAIMISMAGKKMTGRMEKG